MSRKESLILSLETAIGGGSIALVQGTNVIAESSLGTARANVILTAVESLLEQANAQIHDIGKLAVSLGPGSFTGIRVGLSTVLGLGRSLSIDIVGVSVFDALAAPVRSDPVAVIIPIGRNMFGCQLFGSSARQITDNGPFVVDKESLVEELSRQNIKSAVSVSDERFDLCSILERSGMDCHLVQESDLAGLIGRYAATRRRPAILDPIYLR